ncbi:MAG TPA: alpha/beta hydrolase-fold protein [Cyclobacteriaceae bacterium]|nr:alpha/beta hydrolase-fold protein [Cyclobacteriaceae bacterium]
MKIRFDTKSSTSKRLHKKQQSLKKYSRALIKSKRSAILNRKVVVEVFFPADAHKSGKRYPLLILNDGQDSKAVKIMACVEQLVQNGEIEEIIIAGVYAHDRMREHGLAKMPDYKKRGDKADKYAGFITRELIPYLQDQYPLADAAHVIAGYSLGGLSALDIAWSHPEQFNKVGVFSGALWWRSIDAADRKFDEQKHRIMHQRIRKSKTKPELKFWFQTGTHDETSDRNHNGIIDSIDDTIDLMEELMKKGYQAYHDIQYLEIVDGTHHQKTWAKAMPYFLRWAFPVKD